MYDGPLPPGPKSKAEPDLRTVHCVALDQKTGVSYYVVPLAVPDEPVLVDHLTAVTPTLSLAVPLKAIVDADVETDVPPGDPIVNDGAVVSVPPVVGGAACRVIVTTCET